MTVPTAEKYDFFRILLHWLTALLVIVLFISGIWMVGLTYYSPWYQLAPWWHKGIGVTTFCLVLFRFLMRCFQTAPSPLSTVKRWQQQLSKGVQTLMDMLVAALMVTGYLIVTAKGQALNVFDLVFIPAVVVDSGNLEDKAGLIHCYLAYGLIVLACGHMFMALKHHFIDRDNTLLRMLGKAKN